MHARQHKPKIVQQLGASPILEVNPQERIYMVILRSRMYVYTDTSAYPTNNPHIYRPNWTIYGGDCRPYPFGLTSYMHECI